MKEAYLDSKTRMESRKKEGRELRCVMDATVRSDDCCGKLEAWKGRTWGQALWLRKRMEKLSFLTFYDSPFLFARMVIIFVKTKVGISFRYVLRANSPGKQTAD